MKFRISTLLRVSLAILTFAPLASAGPFVYVVTLSQQFGTLDLATGKFQAIGRPTADSLSNLVWAPNGYLYTLTVSGADVGSLATINPVTGEVKDIGATGLGFNAFDLAGVRGKLYATDFSNNLYSIDRDSGVATPVADTGMPPDPTIPFTYNSDGTFNVCDESLYGVDGKLYATFDSFAIDPKTLATPVTVEPALYRINSLTGATKRIAATDLKLSASVQVEGKFYAFRGVLSGFDGFPQAYSQVVRLNLETGKTTWVANVDPSIGLILGAAPVRFTTFDFPGRR
ncbi:MAG: hypothetical protein JO159_12940 [Acidobacteria bacterium]|nr:hypothetical protein [Acidobacteriota bacterium]MBV9624026.1 hypothetical protein [Acidobacteriota bacterium]